MGLGHQKKEALSRLMLFGERERSLRHALTAYVTHFHQEHPHQGKGHVVLMPMAERSKRHEGPISCQERLAGLLKYYYRAA